MTAALMAAVTAFTVDSASAQKAPPVTKTPSFLTLGASGNQPSVNESPCTSGKSCANGVRFSWPAAQCFDKDRMNPIIIVWTVNGKIPANNWPVFASCSTGIQLTWGVNNKLTDASWIGSSSPHAGMTVCFGKQDFCSKSDCVTMGCLPKSTNGADVFFQGGDTLSDAQWTLNGAVLGSAAPVDVSEVSWSGSSPNTLSFPRSGVVANQSTSTPHLHLLGRNGGNAPQSTTTGAPGSANGVNFKWFLSPAGRNKQCINAGTIAWTNPPVVFEYTSGGALNAPVSVLPCSMNSVGSPIFFNGVNFQWTRDASGNHLTTAQPTYNGMPMTTVSNDSVPQPPANTDGVIFEFHHDDYQWTNWSADGTAYTNTVPAPGHTRMGSLGW